MPELPPPAAPNPPPQTPQESVGGGIPLVNRQGQTQTFAPEDVNAAYQSGQWTTAKGTLIPIVVNSEYKAVPIAQLGTHLAAGAGLANPQAYQEAELQRQYGDIGHQLEAGAVGAVKAVPLVGAAALSLLPREARESVRKSVKANPISTGVGTVASIAGQMALSGGLGGAARGAAAVGEGAELASPIARAALEAAEASKGIQTGASIISAPTRAISAVGDLVEQGVAKILPKEAETLMGRMAVRAASTGARMGVEGGIYGEDNYISDQAISENPDLSASKMLSSIGYGSLLGVGGGVLLGAAGPAIEELVGRNANRISSVSENVAAKHLGVEPQVARKLLDDGVVQAGDKTETVLSKVQAAQTNASAKLTELEGRLDATGAKGPKLEDVVDTFESKVAKHLEADDPLKALGVDFQKLKPSGSTIQDYYNYIRTPEGKAKFNALSPEEFAKIQKDGVKGIPSGFLPTAKVETSFAKAADLQAQLSKAMTTTEDPAILKGLKSVSDKLGETLSDAKNKAVKSLGTDHEWVTAYKEATENSKTLTSAAEGIAKKLESKKGEPSSMMGGMLAAAHIMSTGTLSPAALGGYALAYGKKLAGERAPLAASVLMDKLVSLEGVQRAVSRVDERIAKGVASAAGESVSKAAPSVPHNFGTYDQKIKAVQDASQNMPAHAQSVAQAIGPMAQHAPSIAASLQTGALRATIFLANAAPKPKPLNPLMPHAGMIPVSDHDKAVFSRTFEAVHDPVSVLNDVAKGTITPEQPAAIQAAHPALKAHMDTKLKNYLATATGPVPYKNAVGISIFLGTPADPTLQPQNVAMLQQTFAPGQGPKGEPGQQKVGKGQGTPKAAKLPLAKQMSLEPGAE